MSYFAVPSLHPLDHQASRNSPLLLYKARVERRNLLPYSKHTSSETQQPKRKSTREFQPHHSPIAEGYTCLLCANSTPHTKHLLDSIDTQIVHTRADSLPHTHARWVDTFIGGGTIHNVNYTCISHIQNYKRSHTHECDTSTLPTRGGIG